MPAYTHLISDCDGVLLDSEAIAFDALLLQLAPLLPGQDLDTLVRPRLGLTLPDPDLHIDEAGEVHFTDPDWAIFYAVINGGGPMGPERLAVRRLSYQESVWVRRAVEGKRVGPVPAMA